MDTKKLRQKILDLAIRGKLVPQDPSDEPASVLLERIRAEKERLIKEGKIKRSRKAATDDKIEAPFELPKGWCWCFLPELCSIPITDGTHQTPTYSDKEHGIPFISSKDVTSQRINWNDIKYITKDLHESLYKRVAPQKNDILLAKNGTTGVAAMVEDDSVFDIYVTLAVIRPIVELVLPTYLWRIINSQFCKEQFDNHLTGIGLPNLHLTDIKKTIIPLPPLAEQKRIANEVKRWFALIDELESNEGDLLKAIDQAKSKILDLAIHGKLVPQDPNEEPAIELLKRINPKFEPYEEEMYGNIVTNWTLAKVDDIGELLSGRDLPNDLCNNESKGIPYLIGASNIDGNSFSFVRWTEHPQVVSTLGDMLISCKGTIGTIVKNNIGNMHIARQFMAIRPKDNCISTDYLHLCLLAIIEEIKKDARGVIPGISRDDLLEKIIPLPPYQEQFRIVAKIEELFAVLDDIKESLE